MLDILFTCTIKLQVSKLDNLGALQDLIVLEIAVSLIQISFRDINNSQIRFW